jgi:hypothetical protein
LSTGFLVADCVAVVVVVVDADVDSEDEPSSHYSFSSM